MNWRALRSITSFAFGRHSRSGGHVKRCLAALGRIMLMRYRTSKPFFHKLLYRLRNILEGGGRQTAFWNAWVKVGEMDYYDIVAKSFDINDYDFA